ncbi:MAG TPA: DoxX family protein [Hyphomicrobiaceae bacterium]|nr:DoxX family protein [Hyphomicrobiaceae bacterium]
MPEAHLLLAQFVDLSPALAPWSEALLRVLTGLALVPHGLRMAFGLFPDTGGPIRSLTQMAEALDTWGYRPGRLWAPLIAFTQLVAGPLLAVGLFTRAAALPVTVFLAVSCYERWRVGGWFWNTQGMEYTLLWAAAALYFLVHGGGALSLDRILFGQAP